MAWIESHQSLRDHPKVLKAARLLGVDQFKLIGHLQALWWWALDYADDGELTDYDDADIAIASGWEADGPTFVNALINAGSGAKKGFIERDAKGQRLHDWDDYAGKLLDRRRRNAEQMRATRARKATLIKEERVTSVYNTEATRDDTCKPTVPNLTGPDRTGPESVSSHEETAPSGASSFRSILDRARTDLESPKANKVGITGRVFENVYGKKPVNGFMAALIRDYEAPYEICCLMVELVGHWNGTDDPQRYLHGALKKKRERTYGNGRSPPVSPYMTDAELAEKTRLDREQLDAIVLQDRKRWQH